MGYPKKMAVGGGANLPVQAQAAMANPAMTGLDRAGAMSGRTMPTVPTAPATPAAPPNPVPGVGMRPGVTGLERAAAMSGRTMPVPGVGMRPAGMKKGGAVKSSASKRADGIAQRGKTRGKMV